MKKQIYLDAAATTPVYAEVVKEMQKFMTLEYGNPSSAHLMGEQASKEINKIRSNIAKEIGCKPHEVIFTSGTTESNNLAIQGAAKSSNKKRIF